MRGNGGHSRALLAVLAAFCGLMLFAPAAPATTLPGGFQQTTALSGLSNAIDVEFAPNGRVFVAEKDGLVKTCDSLSDPTPTVFADLRTQVYGFYDRGIEGIAVDPNFPANPYVYVYYVLRRADRRDRSDLGRRGPGLRRLPGAAHGTRRDQPRLCRQHPRLALADERRGDDRARAGPAQRTRACSTRATTAAESRSAPTETST